MAKVDLVVGIGAEYKGKPAFKKALTDTQKLTNSVKSLAKGYVGLLGAQKAFAYGLQSLKAFAEDDLAAKKLTKTVGNLGLAYEATNIENFIQGLEKTYHVADDLLRPAFSKLISTTQSYTKAKELMNLALNASVGAGVDLNTTVNDLTQAYVGNTRGLNKYKLGLTKAELAAKSFDELQQIIANRFAGQASQAADTYAFKLNALTIASGNAKEIIGRGLTDAITSAFGGGQIDKATSNIEKMAKVVADIVAGLGTMTGWFTKLVKLTDKLTVGNFLQNRQPSAPFDPMSMKVQDLTPAGLKLIKQRKIDDAAAAKRQKEITKLAQAAAKAEKERLAIARLKKIEDQASLLFNMDLIQNTAALMGKVTEDEKLRLKTQQALLLGNSEQAGALAQQLLSAQITAMKLANLNPVGGWTDAFKSALDALKQLREELAKLGISTSPIPTMMTPSQILEQDYLAALADAVDPAFAGLDARRGPVNGGYSSYNRDLTATELRIFIDPSAAAYGINAAVVGANANGAASTVNRNGVFSYGS